jgi:hypothetical protein
MQRLIYEKRKIVRHLALSLIFLATFILLNRPEVILISHLGSVVWYPATGLAFALLLGVNPYYGILVSVAGALAGMLIYGQPLTTYSETIGSIGFPLFYAIAARDLRGTLKIDLGLRRRRDVVLYVSITTLAAVASTLVGVTCLALDHAIRWSEFGSAFMVWLLGDEIGLLGVAPFLLIHVLPWVRGQLSPGFGRKTAGAPLSPQKEFAFLEYRGSAGAVRHDRDSALAGIRPGTHQLALSAFHPGDMDRAAPGYTQSGFLPARVEFWSRGGLALLSACP